MLNALKTLWTPYGAIIGPGLVDPTGHVIEPYGNGMETAGRFTVGAFDLMRRTWGQMVDPAERSTRRHCASSRTAPAESTALPPASPTAGPPRRRFSSQVLGVTPVEPGYATWSIRPHPGDLAWAQGVVPTRYGDIAANWSSSRGVFGLHASTPTGTTGTIAVPAAERALVIVSTGPMIAALRRAHRGATFVFYLDVSVEETLRRHAMRPQATEFTGQDMRDWYHPRDLLGFPDEHLVPGTSTIESTIASIAAVADLPLTAQDDDLLPAPRAR